MVPGLRKFNQAKNGLRESGRHHTGEASIGHAFGSRLSGRRTNAARRKNDDSNA